MSVRSKFLVLLFVVESQHDDGRDMRAGAGGDQFFHRRVYIFPVGIYLIHGGPAQVAPVGPHHPGPDGLVIAVEDIVVVGITRVITRVMRDEHKMLPRTRSYARDAIWEGLHRQRAAQHSPLFAEAGRSLRWPPGRRGIDRVGSLFRFFKIVYEIGYRFDAQLSCLAASHHQCVGIVETDGGQPGQIVCLSNLSRT